MIQLTRRGGLWLLVAAPVIAAGTWLPALEWVGLAYVGLAVALLVLDLRLAGGVERFDVKREHEARLSLGTENPIRLIVWARNAKPMRLWIRDEAPEAFGIDPRILSGVVPARQPWRGVYRVWPPRRGDYAFGAINLRWSGPLGLVLRQGRIAGGASVRVYPNLLEARRYGLMMRRSRLQELGLKPSRVMGQGTEFESLREYLPDDDFRRINWKATARRHSPITSQYQVERSQNVIAVLDVGRMMQAPAGEIAKLDYAVNAVLLLAYVASGRGDRVGLMTFADEVSLYLSPRHGRGQFYRMLEALYAVQAEPFEPDYRTALNYLALRQRKRSLIVLFTDVGGGLSTDALVRSISVLARKNLPLVVSISDTEIHLAARQRPRDSFSTYQRAAAEQLLDERQLALDKIRKRGIPTLDVPATHLSIAVINRYLELKARALL